MEANDPTLKATAESFKAAEAARRGGTANGFSPFMDPAVLQALLNELRSQQEADGLDTSWLGRMKKQAQGRLLDFLDKALEDGMVVASTWNEADDEDVLLTEDEEIQNARELAETLASDIEVSFGEDKETEEPLVFVELCMASEDYRELVQNSNAAETLHRVVTAAVETAARALDEDEFQAR